MPVVRPVGVRVAVPSAAPEFMNTVPPSVDCVGAVLGPTHNCATGCILAPVPVTAMVGLEVVATNEYQTSSFGFPDATEGEPEAVALCEVPTIAVHGDPAVTEMAPVQLSFVGIRIVPQDRAAFHPFSWLLPSEINSKVIHDPEELTAAGAAERLV